MNDPVFMASLHAGTPSVITRDARGLSVRTLKFVRHPDTPALAPQLTLARHYYGPAGLPLLAFGARALADQRPDITQAFALGGAPLLTDSVDAGRTLALFDVARRSFWACSAESTVTTWEYEPASLSGRLLAIAETPTQGVSRVYERFVWGGEAEKSVNLSGVVTHHYDNAGLQHHRSAALTGDISEIVRTLLRDEAIANWVEDTEAQWPNQLETQQHLARSLADAAAASLTQTNAAGLIQNTVYDITGAVKRTSLTLPSADQHVVLANATFTAAGELLTIEHGNGVTEHYEYDPPSRRLIQMTARRPTGHPSGPAVLQDLHYAYDPVGNIISRDDKAVAVRYWRNQEVAAQSVYTYDTLYRLTAATGRELAVTGSTPMIPLPDDGAWTLYSEQYSYDVGNNLTQICHISPTTNNNWTRVITVSDLSNRGLSREGLTPGDVEALFTPGGAQRELTDGRALHWGADGQLASVTPITREDQADDEEIYRYAGAGNRARKLSTRHTGATERQDRVTYLPGLEWREVLSNSEVIAQVAVTQVGSLRIISDQTRGETVMRMSLADQLGSAGLELDEEAMLISREEYYPYGGTAGYGARNAVEAADKARRYSGKERDATGLYYYGYRYYQTDSGRWLSADPAGTVDGLNLYRMVRNNPIKLKDAWGFVGLPPTIPGFPLDILATEFSKAFTNTYFGDDSEEIIWDPDNKLLIAKGSFLYKSELDDSLELPEDFDAQFFDSIDNFEGSTAYAVFQGRDNALHLFATKTGSHTAIDPELGMPLLAGIVNKTHNGKYVFNNSSGHYKPDISNEQGAEVFKQLFPEAQGFVRYSRAFETSGVPRLPLSLVDSPRAYSNLVDRLKDNQKLGIFLEEHDLMKTVRENAKDWFSAEAMPGFLNPSPSSSSAIQRPPILATALPSGQRPPSPVRVESTKKSTSPKKTGFFQCFGR